jgi:hypothetical protein
MDSAELLRQAVTPAMVPWLVVVWVLAACLPYLNRRKGKQQ